MILFAVLISAVMTTVSNAALIDSIERVRRNVEEGDEARSWMYWNQPIALGVYINNDYVSEYDAPAAARTYKRTMPSDGSGSGSGGIKESGKRSRVPKPLKEEHSKPETYQAEQKSELSANVSHVEEMNDEESTKRTTTITCQGQKDWLQCPMYRLIKINSAFWGRDDTKTCVKSGIEHGLKTSQICAQDESNTMIKVQNACDGESACELVASPVYFDRTDCPDIYKFMRVNWECAHSESRIKDTIQEEKEEIARHMIDEGKTKNL